MGSAPRSNVTLLLLLALLTTHPRTASRTGPDTHSATQCSDPLRFQVLLDKLGFSPGEIDGTDGPNLRRALSAFQTSVNLNASGTADCATWEALSQGAKVEALTDYQLTEVDAQGPYLDRPLPTDLAAQAQLESLSYASVRRSDRGAVSCLAATDCPSQQRPALRSGDNSPGTRGDALRSSEKADA